MIPDTAAHIGIACLRAPAAPKEPLLQARADMRAPLCCVAGVPLGLCVPGAHTCKERHHVGLLAAGLFTVCLPCVSSCRLGRCPFRLSLQCLDSACRRVRGVNWRNPACQGVRAVNLWGPACRQIWAVNWRLQSKPIRRLALCINVLYISSGYKLPLAPHRHAAHMFQTGTTSFAIESLDQRLCFALLWTGKQHMNRQALQGKARACGWLVQLSCAFVWWAPKR